MWSTIIQTMCQTIGFILSKSFVFSEQFPSHAVCSNNISYSLISRHSWLIFDFIVIIINVLINIIISHKREAKETPRLECAWVNGFWDLKILWWLL